MAPKIFSALFALPLAVLAVVFRAVLSFAFSLLDRGLLPDVLLRFGVRHMLETERLAPLKALSVDRVQELEETFIGELKRHKTIAVETEKANEQHYEVPTEFFRLCLGPRLKYSSCEWNAGTKELSVAENQTFATYAKRAQLEEGMSILDLGCGWGSLTLWLMEHIPRCKGDKARVLESRIFSYFLSSQCLVCPTRGRSASTLSPWRRTAAGAIV
jgi:cyclopropane-fatty-acyl-phospholipid synthase